MNKGLQRQLHGLGILLPDYRIAVHPTGAFEAYDYRLNELEAVRPSPEVAAEVLQALSRFYRSACGARMNAA